MNNLIKDSAFADEAPNELYQTNADQILAQALDREVPSTPIPQPGHYQDAEAQNSQISGTSAPSVARTANPVWKRLIAIIACSVLISMIILVATSTIDIFGTHSSDHEITGDASALTDTPSVSTKDPSVFTDGPSASTDGPSALTVGPSTLTVAPSSLADRLATFTTVPSTSFNPMSFPTTSATRMTAVMDKLNTGGNTDIDKRQILGWIGSAVSLAVPKAAPVEATVSLLSDIFSSAFGGAPSQPKPSLGPFFEAALEDFKAMFENVEFKGHIRAIQSLLIELNVDIGNAIDNANDHLITSDDIAELYKHQEGTGGVRYATAEHIGYLVGQIAEACQSTDVSVVDTGVEQLHALIPILQFRHISFNLVAAIVGSDKGPTIQKSSLRSLQSHLSPLAFLQNPNASHVTFMSAFYTHMDPTQTILFLEQIWDQKFKDPMHGLAPYFSLYHKGDKYLGFGQFGVTKMVSPTLINLADWVVYVSAKPIESNVFQVQQDAHRGKYLLNNYGEKFGYSTLKSSKYDARSGKWTLNLDTMPVAIFEVENKLIVAHAQEPNKYRCLYDTQNTAEIGGVVYRIGEWSKVSFKVGDPGKYGHWDIRRYASKDDLPFNP